MKVQSWFTLLVTVLFGGGGLIYELRNPNFDPLPRLVMCAFFLYIIVRGLYVSLSAEGYADDQARAARGKRIYREKFGLLAPIAPYGGPLLILLDAALLWLFPNIWRWILVLPLVAAVAYSAWLSLWYQKQMELAESASD